jgi:spore maturation protein CgeB
MEASLTVSVANNDGPRRKIVVFRTMPDHLNSNFQIETFISEALRRVALGYDVISVPGTIAEEIILEHKPVFVLGVGSIALDLIDFDGICRAARKIDARIAYWLHDDPYEFDFGWKLKGKCDWVFNTDRASVDHSSFEFTSHLPLAADVATHIRPIRPYRDRGLDVFFCGYAYPNRRDVVARLRDVLSRCRTEIRGVHWDESIAFCKNERINADRLIDAYTDSRIVLNLGRHFNIANKTYEIAASTPGPRTFEAAAAGCVQVFLLETMEIFDFFERETEILTFSCVQDMCDIVDLAISKPEVLEAIATACQQRVLAEHTYDHRVKQLISTLSESGIWQSPLVVD